MVCAEGLRVWRSFRNWVNQSGNGSALGVPELPGRPGSAAGRVGGTVGHPSTVTDKMMDNQSYPSNKGISLLDRAFRVA